MIITKALCETVPSRMLLPKQWQTKPQIQYMKKEPKKTSVTPAKEKTEHKTNNPPQRYMQTRRIKTLATTEERSIPTKEPKQKQ